MHQQRDKARGWYANITCELPDAPKVEPTDAIAVDVGTTHYLTTSKGEKEDNPRWYRQAEGLLRKHSKAFSRKKKGSHRWRKQQHTLALHHERTANKRKDFSGERWVTTLNEARNKNEAQDKGNLENAEQLFLFNDLLTGFPSL